MLVLTKRFIIITIVIRVYMFCLLEKLMCVTFLSNLLIFSNPVARSVAVPKQLSKPPGSPLSCSLYTVPVIGVSTRRAVLLRRCCCLGRRRRLSLTHTRRILRERKKHFRKHFSESLFVFLAPPCVRLCVCLCSIGAHGRSIRRLRVGVVLV